MIVIGAGGHAKEIAGILCRTGEFDPLCFYDDVNLNAPSLLFGKFRVLRNEEQLKSALQEDLRFVIGIGNPNLRFKLAEKFSLLGGVLTSVISPHAYIGSLNVELAEGLNVMPGAVITEDVAIGKGCLVHVQASIHHDCRIGAFCELLPGSRILGNVLIGDFTSIGSGAVVLPKIKIGSHVIVGAGAVVTKDIPDGFKVKGVPARQYDNP